MSTCIDIITEKEINPMEIVEHLAQQGERILILNDEFPHFWFAASQESTRGVEVNKADYGYEVRMCIYSSRKDYQLSLDTIRFIQQKTNGTLLICDEEIHNIGDFFSETAIEEYFTSEQNTINAFLKEGHKISIGGMFCDITLGKDYFQRIGITDKDSVLVAHEKLMKDILHIQWCHENKKGTSTRLQISKSENDDKKFTLSTLLFAENGSDYDYIHDAPIFNFYNGKKDESCMINYKYLKEIAPDSWTMFDERQYDIAHMTYEECVALMEKAASYANKDLFED